jgi:hypothetical protein
MTSKASWAVTARADKWWQDQEPQEVIDIVEELVDNENSDPSSAAQRVCALYEPLVKQNPTEATGAIWGILFQAVRGIRKDEGALTRLRDFVLAVHRADDVLDESGEPVKDKHFGSVVWRDLPGFSHMYRDYCISKLPSFLVNRYHRLTSWKDIDPFFAWTAREWLDQAPTLLSASTFGALFLSKTPFPTRMSFFASVGLIYGLEVSYPQDQIQQAVMYIPPATAWIRHAGVSIHKFCVDRHNGGAVCGALEPGCTWGWTGGNEFSIERWQFWKRRLGEIAAEQSLDEHLRSMAKEAEAKMDNIERTAT